MLHISRIEIHLYWLKTVTHVFPTAYFTFCTCECIKNYSFSEEVWYVVVLRTTQFDLAG